MDMGLLPPLQALIRLRRTDPTLLAQDQAVLENFVMEERVHGARLAHYATTAGTTPWTSLSEFFDGHSHRYLQPYVALEKSDPGVPHTFESSLNGGNFWPHIEENLALYRVEGVVFALKGSGVDEVDLEQAIEAMAGRASPHGKPEASAILARVCDNWNARRDRRPLFATTEPEIERLLIDHSAEWANTVRDHFGLGHLNPRVASEPVKILLMRYTVKEVLAAAKAAGYGGFCIPTVLDGSINPHFFPTPLPSAGSPAGPQGVGRAVNLRPVATQSEYVMGLELIHSYVEYRPEHLVRQGLVSRPLTVDLGQLRSFHLEWLRLDTERDDFGCDLAHV